MGGYAPKPLQPAILLARARSLHKRLRADRPAIRIERFGAYVFDKAAKTVYLHRKPVRLTARRFDLAYMLFKAVDRTVSRRDSFDKLWGKNLGSETRTLDVHICMIRSAMALQPPNGFRLVAVYGQGYRLETVDLIGETVPEAAFSNDQIP